MKKKEFVDVYTRICHKRHAVIYPVEAAVSIDRLWSLYADVYRDMTAADLADLLALKEETHAKGAGACG